MLGFLSAHSIDIVRLLMRLVAYATVISTHNKLQIPLVVVLYPISVLSAFELYGFLLQMLIMNVCVDNYRDSTEPNSLNSSLETQV